MKGNLLPTTPVGVPTGVVVSLTASDINGLLAEAKARLANPHLRASNTPQGENNPKPVYRLWDSEALASDGLPPVVGILLVTDEQP